MPSRTLPSIALALLLGVAGLGAGVAGDACGGDHDPPVPSVWPHEAIDVGPSGPPSAAEMRRVEALAATLSKLSRFRLGLTMRTGIGTYFEPTDARAGAPAPPSDPAESAFRDLVALGPAALPALLERLDDPTPTALVLEHHGGFGGMWLSSEVEVNSAWPDEARAVDDVLGVPEGSEADATGRDSMQRGIERHVVTIGDVCFALVGQITNRPYEAVRGQPTACAVVNSPTSDPRIALAVRAQWAGKDLRRALAQRLDADLWSTGDGERATGALRRLLAYYPAAVETLAVRLLDAVDAPHGARSPELPRGIDARLLAFAAGRSDRPALRAALVRLTPRARDPAVLLTALRALPDLRDDALRDPVGSVIDAASADSSSGYLAEHLLEEVEARWPDAYPDVLRRLLKSGAIEAVRVVVGIAHREGTPLPVEAWRPLLDVRGAATRWQSTPPAPLERLRVCDIAASQIARRRADLPFDESEETEQRDEWIAKIRRALDAAPKPRDEEGR